MTIRRDAGLVPTVILPHPGTAPARIAGLDAAGQTLRQIAAATGVSTFTVRAALGRGLAGRPGPGRRRWGPGRRR